MSLKCILLLFVTLGSLICNVVGKEILGIFNSISYLHLHFFNLLFSFSPLSRLPERLFYYDELFMLSTADSVCANLKKSDCNSGCAWQESKKGCFANHSDKCLHITTKNNTCPRGCRLRSLESVSFCYTVSQKDDPCIANVPIGDETYSDCGMGCEYVPESHLCVTAAAQANYGNTVLTNPIPFFTVLVFVLSFLFFV